MKDLKIVLASWAPFVGGAEVAVERLAVGLSEAGHEVLLVVGTDGDSLSKFCERGIRCEFCPQHFTDKRHWLRYRKSRNGLLEILRREVPDVVHSNDLPTHQMVSDAARRLGIPRVCHHRWIFEGAAIDWLNKYGAERHVFVSEYLRDDLCAKSPRLTTTPCSVVYDGLSLPQIPSDRERTDARQRLGLPSDRCLVLYAGQVIERKGVADLLHAWTLLANESPAHAELVVVGDDLEGKGAYRQEMEQLAARLDCPARFLGFQTNVPDWLLAADVAVVPSHAEPLGNATLEAMSYGLPVLGSRVGGIPEMVLDGTTGLLVPPRSPKELATGLARLIGDAALRRKLGDAARRRCEQVFSLEAHVENVLVEYKQVINPVKSRSA